MIFVLVILNNDLIYRGMIISDVVAFLSGFFRYTGNTGINQWLPMWR
jgi:hypothetical protein